MQTTPVQAELAKIWTNILRYATFALPNLLMMDCEQYGANVFEVIELINRDYPRGGMTLPGFTAGTCLRKDFAFSEERSTAPGMLLAVSRVQRDACRCSSSRASSAGSAVAARAARSRCSGLAFKADTDDERDSLSHKLIRLLERELADVAVHDPHVADADGVLRRGGRWTPTPSSSRPTTASSAPREALRQIARARGARPDRRPVELLGAAQVFALRDEVVALADVGAR